MFYNYCISIGFRNRNTSDIKISMPEEPFKAIRAKSFSSAATWFLSICSVQLHFFIAEFSNSQHDVRGDLLTVDLNQKGTCFCYSTQKSLSDTDISKSCSVSQSKLLNVICHHHKLSVCLKKNTKKPSKTNC